MSILNDIIKNAKFCTVPRHGVLITTLPVTLVRSSKLQNNIIITQRQTTRGVVFIIAGDLKCVKFQSLVYGYFAQYLCSKT